jgi:hypothetical protein
MNGWTNLQSFLKGQAVLDPFPNCKLFSENAAVFTGK